ncbi:MAG: transcriptional regulator [Bacteroidetes bacterium]|nr:transcriptional regulator [Bacteroidota bacterium]
MYVPKHFEEKDLIEIAELVKEFGFATLVSTVDGLPWATHIPLELVIDDEGKWKLHGHIARANPQWRNFEDEPEVLAIFMGPHSYVSPSWYDRANVPTWNYKAVHMYGKAEIIEGEALVTMLRGLMKRYETAHAEKPLAFDDIPRDILDKDLRGVVGLEITIERIQASSKLSQNRNDVSYASVIDNLKKIDAYDSKRIAEEMEKRRGTPKPLEGGFNTRVISGVDSASLISDTEMQNANSMFYGSSPIIFENAKKLRENLTFTESKLWEYLKEKQLGVKFRSQHPISRYIADFYCHSLKLVVEIDGEIHHIAENKENNNARDEEMERLGLKVLRFSADDVMQNIEQVLLTIKMEIPQTK